jgi:hypothetical protein
MFPLAEEFSYRCPTFRTSLASSSWIDSLKICASLPTDPLKQRQKCSKRSINTFFSQHPSVESNRIEIFSKNGLSLVAKAVSSLKVEILASIANMVMQSGYFDLGFFPVFRTLILSCRSALQQFQLTLQTFQKFRRFNRGAIRSSQEFFKSEVNSYSSPMYGSIGNRYLRRNGDNHIPLSIPASRDDPHLFDRKPVWDWAMQVDCHCSNFGKPDMVASDGIALELRIDKGSKLPVLFESGKSKPSFLKCFPSVMQSTNRCLQHLRMRSRQIWMLLLSFGQLVLLPLITRKWSIGRDYILPTQRTSIYQTLSRCQPIFHRAQRMIVDLATGFQPSKHKLLLGSIGIDSIGEVHCQHDSTIAQAGSRISRFAFIYWRSRRSTRHRWASERRSGCIPPPKRRGYSATLRYIPLVYGGGLNPTFKLKTFRGCCHFV